MWGKYEGYDFEKHLSTAYEKIVFFEEKPLFVAVWKSRKKIHCGSFQTDKLMAARFVTERYSIQSSNGNAKSTTSKTIANQDHLSALEKRIEFWESGELMELV